MSMQFIESKDITDRHGVNDNAHIESTTVTIDGVQNR